MSATFGTDNAQIRNTDARPHTPKQPPGVSPPPHPILNVGLMLALTFSTSVVDAVGYLGLDQVFTGNMTGNVVILGMALTGAQQLPVVGPTVVVTSTITAPAAESRPAGGAANPGSAAGAPSSSSLQAHWWVRCCCTFTRALRFCLPQPYPLRCPFSDTVGS